MGEKYHYKEYAKSQKKKLAYKKQKGGVETRNTKRSLNDEIEESAEALSDINTGHRLSISGNIFSMVGKSNFPRLYVVKHMVPIAFLLGSNIKTPIMKPYYLYFDIVQ